MRILSVCPPRQTRALWQNEIKFCPDYYITWKNVYPSFKNKKRLSKRRSSFWSPALSFVFAGRQQPIACRSKIAATNFYISKDAPGTASRPHNSVTIKICLAGRQYSEAVKCTILQKSYEIRSKHMAAQRHVEWTNIMRNQLHTSIQNVHGLLICK